VCLPLIHYLGNQIRSLTLKKLSLTRSGLEAIVREIAGRNLSLDKVKLTEEAKLFLTSQFHRDISTSAETRKRLLDAEFDMDLSHVDKRARKASE